jgi:hypothetical protein
MEDGGLGRLTPRCSDALGSSHGPRPAGAEDDIRGHSSPGQARGVARSSFEVVEVLVEVLLERGDLGRERAGKGWPPALLDDRSCRPSTQPFGSEQAALIRRWPAPSAATARPNPRNTEPLSVVTSRGRRRPPSAPGHGVHELPGPSGPRLALPGVSSLQGEAGAGSAAVYCQAVPSVPWSRPT